MCRGEAVPDGIHMRRIGTVNAVEIVGCWEARRRPGRTVRPEDRPAVAHGEDIGGAAPPNAVERAGCRALRREGPRRAVVVKHRAAVADGVYVARPRTP